MYYRFNMSKMIERVKKMGLYHLVGREELKIMQSLDGKLGTDYNWAQIVHGNESQIWIPADKDQPGYYVNIADCDPFNGHFEPWEDAKLPEGNY